MALSKSTVRKLIAEGFRPYPKNDPVLLFCSSMAWGKITGYRERTNNLTKEFISAHQPSLPRMTYSEQKALHALIYKVRISVANGQVYFIKKGEQPLEGLEASLAYNGKNEFPGVEKTLLRHIAALENRQDLRGDPPRNEKEGKKHV